MGPLLDLMAVRSITDYGAVSGADNNTAAVQAAIDAASPGDDLYVPSGGYLMRTTASPWCGRATKRLNITGPGTLIMHPDDARSGTPKTAIALLYFTAAASGSTVRGVSMEGSKLNPDQATAYDPDLEHHRAMFFDGTSDVTVEDVTIRNFTGDGAQLYNSCERFVFRRCVMEWQQRDNITLSPSSPLTPVRDVLIEYCTLRGAPGQQIDNEHGPAHDVVIRYSTIDAAPVSLDSGLGLAIAGAGTDISDPSTGWDIHDNLIYGGVRYTWTSYSKIRNNTIINAQLLPGIELQRGQTDNEVTGNVIAQTDTTTANLSAIYLSGTVGGGASNILISGNIATLSNRSSFGIRADGAISADIIGNVMVGTGLTQAGFFGARARVTQADRPMTRFRVINNAFHGFGQAGIGIRGSVGGESLDYAEIRGNAINGCATGMSLDDGLGTLKSALVYGNTYGSSVSSQVADVPGGASMAYSVQETPGPSGARHKSIPTSV